MGKNNFERYAFILEMFLLGSFIGFVHENLLTFIKGGTGLKQGLIYEPLIPIYGLGLIVFFLAYRHANLENRNLNKFMEILVVFLIGFFMGGITEYICSVAQERIFGTISWNYSRLRFNLNGRVSLAHSSGWGLMGILFYKGVYPFLIKEKPYLKKDWYKIVTVVISCVLLFDCSVSFMACYRQTRRRDNIPPINRVEEFFDVHYTDEFLNTIYTNARVPKK